jgi:glutaredoxin 3
MGKRGKGSYIYPPILIKSGQVWEGEMEVKVYSTSACPYCNMAKQFLDSKGVRYEEVDVSSDPEKQREMVEKSGQMGVPVLDIGGKIIVGFDKAAIEAALSEPGKAVQEPAKPEPQEEK